MEISIGAAVDIMTSLAAEAVEGSSGSTTATASTAAATQNGIQSLISEGLSLIDSVYPSTLITDIGTLTWPSTVVIGSETYTIHPSSSQTSFQTTTSASSSTPTGLSPSSTLQNANPVETAIASVTPNTNASSGEISSQSNQTSDKKLGIILGVALGSIALGLFIFLVWWLYRRNRNTGSFFKRRSPSTSDEEIFSWRHNNSGEKYSVIDTPAPAAMAAHGVFASRSWTRDDDAMYPHRHQQQPTYAALDGSSAPAELSAIRHSSEETFVNRPPTPFSPADFIAMTRSPVSPVDAASSQNPWSRQPSNYYTSSPQQPESRLPRAHEYAPFSAPTEYNPHPVYQNPFASHEDSDDDNEDHGGPLEPPPEIPSRSPRRMSSPRVSYPSGTHEFEQFDFGLDGRARSGGRSELEGEMRSGRSELE